VLTAARAQRKGMEAAHLRDSAVFVNFFAWLEARHGTA
jgi:hypothetical protein